MKIKLPILLCIILPLLQGCSSRAVGGPENVLVVSNANSPVSQRIASYYMEERGITSKYLVNIRTIDSSLCATNESISPKDYIEQIHRPIQSYLDNQGLTNKIQYIVLTKGVPFKLSSDPTGGSSGGQSVDSILATMGMAKPPMLIINNNGKNIGNPIINRYWRSNKPFSHAEYGGYLVTRLDGYTEADAKALVDRALAPSPVERIVLLDADLKKGLGDPSVQPISLIAPDGSRLPETPIRFSDFNADMIHLHDLLLDRKQVNVVLDRTNDFVCNAKPLTVYVSWGSNDSKFNADTYHSLKFAPRSLAETAVSSSGRTLLKTTGGQSLIADLIAQGAAGAKGYVTEPYLFAMASPSVFVCQYISGRNLAESFYSGSRLIGWKDIVLGDPLCCLEGSK